MIEQILREQCSKEDLIKVIMRSQQPEIMCHAISCIYNVRATCGTPSKHVLSSEGHCCGKTIKPMKSVTDEFDKFFR